MKARLIRADLEGEGLAPALIVGDTEVDLQAGQALGLATIAVCNGIRAPQLLEAMHPNWLLEDIASVPRAVRGLECLASRLVCRQEG